MGERSRAAERDHCHGGIDRDPAACSIPASGHGLYSTAAYPVVVPTHENLRLEHQLCVALYNALIKLRPEWAAETLKVVMTGSAEDGPEVVVGGGIIREALARQ